MNRETALLDMVMNGTITHAQYCAMINGLPPEPAKLVPFCAETAWAVEKITHMSWYAVIFPGHLNMSAWAQVGNTTRKKT